MLIVRNCAVPVLRIVSGPAAAALAIHAAATRPASEAIASKECFRLISPPRVDSTGGICPARLGVKRANSSPVVVTALVLLGPAIAGRTLSSDPE